MKIMKWEPDNFELEMTTVWSFPERGNWSPYIPRNLFLESERTDQLRSVLITERPRSVRGRSGILLKRF